MIDLFKVPNIDRIVEKVNGMHMKDNSKLEEDTDQLGKETFEPLTFIVCVSIGS